jgi:hypothetical protein
LLQIELICEEIKRRLNSGNACYHSAQNLLSSRLLSKNVKIRIYKTIILPVVLYGCCNVLRCTPLFPFPRTFSFRAAPRDGWDPPPLRHAAPPTGRYFCSMMPELFELVATWSLRFSVAGRFTGVVQRLSAASSFCTHARTLGDQYTSFLFDRHHHYLRWCRFWSRRVVYASPSPAAPFSPPFPEWWPEAS